MSKNNNKGKITKDFLEEVYESMPVVVVLIDFEGNIIYANSFVEELLGFTKEEIKKKDLTKLCIDCDPERIIETPLKDEEITLKGKKEEVSVSVFSKASESKEGILVFFKSLRRAKEIEKEVEEKVEELKRFNRLATGRELKMVELKREKNNLKEKNERLKSKQRKMRSKINQLEEKLKRRKKEEKDE